MDSEEGAFTGFYSSSTSLPVPGGEYDVFLSFRGPDTRYTFSDFLYTHLHSLGVRTFRDDNELRKGEEIGPELLKAIRDSKISIPIFSKNYASSKWCLRELAQMAECKRTMGQLILPIFYDVEPLNVRHQSGSYEEAFYEYQRCFDDGTVEEWKQALREVGALKGWEVKKEADGYQGKLIKEIIVPTVLLELKKNYMIVTDNLIGIDHHQNEMMRLIDVTNNVRVIGIHGMGGIGKTTIAKFIYNKLLECFECSSFLADVRETGQQLKGLVSLQKQLLSDTLNWGIDIADVDSGIKAIRNRFVRKKVLIVLDDVNERSQFDCLVGKRDWFGTGSRIIVTTRDKHILNAIGVDGTYNPPLMNDLQSLQLFSIHAFRTKFPPKDFDGISKEVGSTAAGLPLALEIIGSFLFDKEKVVWEDTLKKLKKIPDDQVQKKLRISYDALNYEQQQIFLDIACFFVGTNKTYVFYMWDDCGYYPEKELNVLCLVSLVQMGDDNVFRMHDQLRDLGREIVRQQNFMNPGRRSRLWDQEEALEVLEGRRGREEVEALSLFFDVEELECQKKQPRFTNKEFAELFNLRFLQVGGANLVGNFKHLLSRLRWLHWINCPHEFKATNFHLKNLVILNLSYSKITEDWKGWSQFKMAKKLKVLDLAYCALRRTPDFSTHGELEILILRNCYRLVEIDPSIGNLMNLKHLDISDCSKVTKLPDEIWMLEKLELIDATGCHSLEGDIPSNMGRLSSLIFLSICNTKIRSLPMSISELLCLQLLDLGFCTELQSLPQLPSSLNTLLGGGCIHNVANLVNLKVFHLTGWLQHEDVPIGIGQLSKLESLTIKYCNVKALPEEIGALCQLKYLEIKYCDNLQYVYGLPSSLVEFYVQHCPPLKRLPNLSNLKKLLKMALRECSELTALQGLGGLESLTSLYIDGCVKLADVKGLGNLESLKDLMIHGSNKLAELDLLEQLLLLPSLEPEEKPELSSLKKLERLLICYCPELNKIQGLDKLESLQFLDLNGCRSIVRLPNLSNLTMLRYLKLENCKKLCKIEGLEGLKSLKSLELLGCTSLEEIPVLPNTLVLPFDFERDLE